jgi:hypothetical protein
MTDIEISRAKQKAMQFGHPGRFSKRASTPKTGNFKGYWDNGSVAWKGSLQNGNPVGLWCFYDRKNPADSCYEFYCNI